MKKIRIFGCPVFARLPGKRPAKLDTHATTSIFLVFTSTTKNIYYQDNMSKRVKIATHVTFDEAGYTIPQSNLSNAIASSKVTGATDVYTPQRISNDLDYMQKVQPTSKVPEQLQVLYIKKLSDVATLPTRATPDSAGLDIYSAVDVSIPPGEMVKVPTDLAIQLLPGTYCQILSRSGMVTKHKIEVKAGTIDADYTGKVTIILENNSAAQAQIHKGDQGAQIVVYFITQPIVQETMKLSETQRGNNGFGHTGIGNKITSPTICSVGLTQDSMEETLQENVTTEGIKPYNIWFSPDPFQKRLTMNIPLTGNHPTLGMILNNTTDNH
jgi:dUTP pyrophosphatase